MNDNQIPYNVPNPPLKWHGGKHYLASKILSLFPQPPAACHFVEPFFGGGAVLLAKNPEGWSEVVNDLDGDLTNFWKVLQETSTADKFNRILQATPFSESEFTQAQTSLAQNREADPIQRAAWFFISCRQSLAGRKDTFAPLSRTRTRRQMNEQASAWLTAVEGLPAVHKRLKRVVILNRPALEVIRSQDGEKTLFYLDPPYLHETRTAPAVFGNYEMAKADHRELLAAIKQVKGKVVLSGYDSELYEAELGGWNRHTFELPNNAASGANKRRMTECIWCNFS
jgi:DNA adenine methylase